jgi:hypothetical protein
MGQAASCRGQVILDGLAVTGGTGTIHFELSSPTVVGLSGAAAIEVGLDQTPEQF